MLKTYLRALFLFFPLIAFGVEDDLVIETPPIVEPTAEGAAEFAIATDMSQETIIVEKRQAERKINLIDFAIGLNRPSYILPY